MKYFILGTALLFSFSCLADDLSFGSFSVNHQTESQTDIRTDLSFASFELYESQGRSIASVEEEASSSVDPVAFGSFE